MNAPSKAVVVGIGVDGSRAAIAHAVVEARRQSLPLHLVHVLQLPAGDAYAALYTDMTEEARATLAAAEDHARALADPETPVTTELVSSGWVVEQLARCAADASLLVLQHRALGRLQRALGGSVVQSVAGRAGAPVFSVPEGRDPTADTRGVVTVAVQDPAESRALLRTAFDEAHHRGSALDVVQAWWMNSGYDVAAVDDTYRAEVATSVRHDLEPVLAPLRLHYPDVDVTITVEHAPPAEAVLDAAERSDLLVVGRRHHLLPLGSHLGHVARSVLAHSPCPVLITPEPARHPVAG